MLDIDRRSVLHVWDGQRQVGEQLNCPSGPIKRSGRPAPTWRFRQNRPVGSLIRLPDSRHSPRAALGPGR